ncbi:MAG: outer membrane protein precursor [Rhodospirillales bacterium]|nr:outer membrane protein precursor [Rhodospirillales bacterium]
MFRGLMLAASAAVISFASAAHADDLWRSQFEVGSFDVFQKANSESFDLQLRPGWRLWDFGVFAGGMYTTKNAYMAYAGITYDLRITDHILILPDAAVGFYQHGDDKNLGNTAEFRTGIGAAYEFDNGWRLGADIHHISNASLSSRNPGVEIAAITLAVPLFGNAAPEAEAAAETTTVAPAAPAPTPRSYLVFFDFDKSDLTPAAQAVVHTAAANAAKMNVTRLTVTGHTDAHGSDAYNMRLSKRRAVSVQQELIHDGVPAGEIAIFAKGKHDLLIPTADGVKEPQNRRVQIVFE